jgi:hypothetical protein
MSEEQKKIVLNETMKLLSGLSYREILSILNMVRHTIDDILIFKAPI